MAGRGRGRSGDHASIPQVMSPASLPPASPLSSVSDLHHGLPGPSMRSGSVVSSSSSALSPDSAAVLYQLQRTTLKAPLLRAFTLADFRVWHRLFPQFLIRSGPEFAAVLQIDSRPDGSSGLPPPPPATVLATVDTLIQDALYPASVTSSILSSILDQHQMDPQSTPARLFTTLTAYFNLGKPSNLPILETEIFQVKPTAHETVEAFLFRLQKARTAYNVAATALQQPVVSDIRLFRHIFGLLPEQLRSSIEAFLGQSDPPLEFLPFDSLFERIMWRLRLSASHGTVPMTFRPITSVVAAAPNYIAYDEPLPTSHPRP